MGGAETNPDSRKGLLKEEWGGLHIGRVTQEKAGGRVVLGKREKSLDWAQS